MKKSFVVRLGIFIGFIGFILAAFGFSFVGISCKQPLPPEPDVVIFPPYQDAADEREELPVIPPDCRLACESLSRVGCPEAAPAGRTCESVCAAAEQQGIRLPTTCIAAASTPDQIRACGMVRCQGR